MLEILSGDKGFPITLMPEVIQKQKELQSNVDILGNVN